MNLTVIIPSKNSANLFPCGAAVRANEPTARIIVVDDGLDAIPEGVEVVRGISPFCYAKNVNLGIAAAISDPSCDGVIALNDDAVLQTPGGFTTMAQACVDYQEFGLIGATTNVVGNPNQFAKNIGLREEPRMVCFLCVYIPRKTIGFIGMLDERYAGYGLDDDDYSFSVKAAGLKIGVHDGCYVDHGSLASSFRGDPKAPADFRPNLRLFVEKWGCDNWGKPA